MNALARWNELLRLMGGVGAAAVMGGVMGMGIDIAGSQASVMAGLVAILVGVAATVFVRAGYPRREKPSTAGTVALMLLLCSYLVVGRLVWIQLGPGEIGAYAASGVVFTWLVFTAVAETPLLSSFAVGGLLGAVSGVVIPLVWQAPFGPLFAVVRQPAEVSLVYAGLGLLCAFSCAFAAVAGRLSGYGLLEARRDPVWRFDEQGRREMPESE